MEIEKRLEIDFLKIGLDRDYTHFLIRSVLTIHPTRVVTTLKRVIVREMFARALKLKIKRWGGLIQGKGILRPHGGLAWE